MPSEAIPALSHPDRRIFEYAYKTDNHILQTSLSLDARIRQLQSHARLQTKIPNSNFTQNITAMEEQTKRALENVRRSGNGSWNEYFRLVSQTAFLEQRILVPLMIEHPDNRQIHRYLANGIYGVNVDILEQELAEFSNHHTASEREELRGAIHEQTVPALIHRNDSEYNFALPSATGDDLQRRIDIDYWRLSESQATYEHIPIQVKTRLRAAEYDVAPDQGIVITAKEMKNESFRTAHLLVSELNNTITANEKQELDVTQQQLIATIDAKYNTLRR